MPTDRPTLARFLAQRRRHGALGALVLDVALACQEVSRRIAAGTLGAGRDAAVVADHLFRRAAERSGRLAALTSGLLDVPFTVPRGPRGTYLLAVDPLDGACDVEVNAPAGSTFSVLRAPDVRSVEAADFCQPGVRQIAAGYAVYGPATVLVLTVGAGADAFVLDPGRGEFVLNRPDLAMPDPAPSRRRHVESASPVAEAHRVLTRGGVLRCRTRLLHAANPLALLVERAGGVATTTGGERVLDVPPRELGQRTSVVLGSRTTVSRVGEAEAPTEGWNPLYGLRGLFHAS